MKTQKTILALALAAAAAVPASALTDGPYSVSFPGSGTTTLDFSNGATISLPKFNVGGVSVLDNINIKISYSGNSDLQFENLGTGIGTVSFSLRAVVFELQRPGGTGVLDDPNALMQYSKSLSPFSFTYAAYDQVTDFGGTSGSSAGSQAYSKTNGAGDDFTSNSDKTLFTGAGNIVLPIINKVGYFISGGGTSSILTPTTGSATVTVEYTYHNASTPVPEPRVYGAIGAVACLGLLGYRRLRARQAAQA
jgi:hypothetical protein